MWRSDWWPSAAVATTRDGHDQTTLTTWLPPGQVTVIDPAVPDFSGAATTPIEAGLVGDTEPEAGVNVSPVVADAAHFVDPPDTVIVSVSFPPVEAANFNACGATVTTIFGGGGGVAEVDGARDGWRVPADGPLAGGPLAGGTGPSEVDVLRLAGLERRGGDEVPGDAVLLAAAGELIGGGVKTRSRARTPRRCCGNSTAISARTMQTAIARPAPRARRCMPRSSGNPARSKAPARRAIVRS